MGSLEKQPRPRNDLEKNMCLWCTFLFVRVCTVVMLNAHQENSCLKVMYGGEKWAVLFLL